MRLINKFPEPPDRCPGRYPFHDWIYRPQEFVMGADCECGRREVHTHCKLCGHLIAVGRPVFDDGVKVGPPRDN